MLFEWAIEIISIAPAAFVLELLVFFNAPVDFPLPTSVDWQEDSVFGQLDFAILITPTWAFMRQKFIVEYAHPNALILKSFELSYFFILKLLVIEIDVVDSAIYRISPILFVHKSFFVIRLSKIPRILAVVIKCVQEVEHFRILF